MELTLDELNNITEIQYNLAAFELDEAIDKLRPEALNALRENCLDCIERQKGILARIQNRLAQN